MGCKVAIQFTGELENKKQIASMFGSDVLFCRDKNQIESILVKNYDNEDDSFQAFVGDYICINEQGKYEVVKK